MVLPSSESDCPAPLGRHFGSGDTFALRSQELPGNPGRANRADQPFNRRGPSFKMVLAQNVQAIGVRAGLDGQVIAVVFPVKGNHAGTNPLAFGLSHDPEMHAFSTPVGSAPGLTSKDSPGARSRLTLPPPPPFPERNG